MIDVTRGVFQGGRDIICFQVRKIGEDIGWVCAVRQHVEDVLDANTQAANARPPSKDEGVYRYSLKALIHGFTPPCARPSRAGVATQDSRNGLAWASVPL